MARRIGTDKGTAALADVRDWVEARIAASDGQESIDKPPRPVLLAATRFCLEELAERFPGGAVEVRVPYAGAVQIIEGLAHRRGTPPNVIETDIETFLGLALGLRSWNDALASGKVDASGTRASLDGCLPLFP